VKKPWRNILLGLLVATAIGLGLWLALGDYAPRYNQPLSGADASSSAQSSDDPPGRGMWPDRREQDDSALVLVAISGGGSRAAAVGWNALQALGKVEYRFNNAEGKVVVSNLANEIDLVAGISGGSFTATAWCLGNGEMERFRKRFVERNLERALESNFVSIKGMLALFSRRYSRINWAAELYDREVFDGKTFAALPARPILRLHATNLALGQRFTFTRGTFAALGSDLGSYPLGYACSASSAFPVLLNPLTLRNYPPPLNLAADLTYLSDKQNARDDLNKDLHVKARDYYNDKSNQYIHLADGGLVDNQGLQSILDEFEDNGLVNKRINYMQSPLRRLLIININAGVAPPNSSGQSPGPPSIPSVVQSTMVSSMDVLSARRWMDIKTRCQQLFAAKIDVGGEVRSYGLLQEPYRIEISFRNIQKPDKLRQAMELPTSFKLTSEQLKFIDGIVPELLREDPEFQRLQMELAK
jgi:NTE family protein